MIKTIFELVKNQTMSKSSAQLLIEKVATNQGNVILGAHQKFAYGDSYIKDHQVLGERLVLGVTHCALALNAFGETFSEALLGGIKNINFLTPVRLSVDERAVVNLNILYNDASASAMQFVAEYVLEKDSTQVPSQGSVTAKGEYISALGERVALDLTNVLDQSASDVYTGCQVYSQVDNVEYGDSLHTIDEVSRIGNRTLSKLSIKQQVLGGAKNYLCHPAILDGAVLAALSPFLFTDEQKTFIPFFIEALYYYKKVGDSVVCIGEITVTNNELVKCNITLCDEEGEVLVDIKGFTCKRVRDSETLLNSIRSAGTVRLDSVKTKAPTGAVNQDVAARTSSISESDKGLLIDKVAVYVGDLLREKMTASNGDVEANKNFMELGLDSASLVDVAAQMEKDLGIELYPTTFFEYQNLTDLTHYLMEEHIAPILTHFAEALPATRAVPQQKSVAPVAAGSFAEPYEQRMPQVGFKDIAVIGMAGVFAESDDVGEFWQHLEQGSDLMAEIPLSRFDYRQWYDPDATSSDKIYCKWGSFIRDVDKFDAEFFNVGHREAEVMDPQLRHMLQTTYLAAEDAGYADKLRGSNTGIYVGCCFYDYQAQMLADGKPIEVYDGIGNSPTMLANRQSFFFDLRGPSLTVDTACSSSLVALHLACQALQRGECDSAMVSGANLLLTPSHYQYFCQIGALGRSGRCHTFDSQADGYIPGEGIATVMLKPLERALADNDQIYGVIKGSAIKHGGYASSVTAPNVKGEEEVIVQAWQQAGIDPATIDYIEAHGTGTALGDPIEFQATEKALRRFSKVKKFCAIGSAKAHVGHLEGAAGIAGVIKVLLGMRNRKIPAMPKFNNLNPYIKADNSPLFVNRETLDWHVSGRPRRAGVNSFGFGGTFVHVVLEDIEPSVRQAPVVTNIEQMIVVSAKTETQLLDKIEELTEWLKRQSTVELADLAYTLQTGREAMARRMVLLCRSVEELLEKLEHIVAGRSCDNVFRDAKEKDAQVAKIFNTDKGLTAAFEDYVKQQPNFGHLAQLWIMGVNIDWQLLHHGSRRLLGVPGHNFVKGSYWYKAIVNLDAEAEVTRLVKAHRFAPREQGVFMTHSAELERLSLEGLWSQLQPWGLFEAMANSPVSIDNVLDHFRVLPKYRRFIGFVLNKMVEYGLAFTDQHGYQLSELGKASQFNGKQFYSDCRHAGAEYPSLNNHIKLLTHCLKNLQACLQGDRQATQVLFAEDSLALVENVYANNAIADHMNENVAHIVVEYAQALAGRQSKVKIVEIGAGTGGTSRHIFAALKAQGTLCERIEYYYTDLSARFMEHAEQNFLPHNPYVVTKRLDIENINHVDAALLGADIVLASNVLHATRTIESTLDNVRDLMAGKPGLLVINELTRAQSFLSLCYGLLDGWWLYKDEQNRIADSPLLNVEQWHNCMANSGFKIIENDLDAQLGQNVLIAVAQQAPKWSVRQPVRSKQSLQSQADQKTVVETGSTLTTILQIISEITRVDRSAIGPGDYFLDLGMDSLKGVEFQDKLNKALGTELKAVALLNYPTANQLAEYIETQVFPKLSLGTEFGRYQVDKDKAHELRKQKNLKGKTHIDKLFELPEQISEVPIESRLRNVFASDKVAIDMIKTCHGEIEAVRAGDTGEVVLLLSPLNSLSVVWHNQIERLSKKYRVVCCHYPGFGCSEFKADTYDIDTLGDTILDVLIKLGMKEPYHILGWSMGGLIAQSICDKYPERVASLSLMGTGTISMFDDDYYNEHTHIKEILKQELDASRYVHPALLANHDLLVGTYNTQVLMHYAQIIRDFDHKRKHTYQVPVLVINGANDKVLLPRYAKELAHNIEGSTYKEIKNAGHFMALTHPGKVDWQLRRFLTSINRKAI